MRPRFAALATSIVASLALLFTLIAAPTAQACSQWNISKFTLRQSNGYFVTFEFDQVGSLLRGPARSVDRRGNPHGRGDVEGSVTGAAVHFTVTWNSFSAGVYDGRIDADGLVSGSSYDKWNPASTASWNGSRRATCVTP